MLLGFTHFFGRQSQKTIKKFSDLEIFNRGMPCSAHSESKRP